MKIIVLGAGVIGLSSAWELSVHGHNVEVWAEKFSPELTSDIAAALWYPYKAGPEVLVRALALRTLTRLVDLVGVSGSGVRLTEGRKVFHRRMGPPWWGESVPKFRFLREHELGEGLKTGYAFEVPTIDMSVHLPFLKQQVESTGVRLVQRALTSLDAALDAGEAVVNCTGLGAKALLGDRSLFPIRGQMVVVEKKPGDTVFLDSDHPDGMIYVIPREAVTVLGGIADDNDWNLEVVAETAAAIHARCVAACPELANRKILKHLVGLRPGRSEIRLVTEKVSGKPVIHNYGHGGSGVTLALGSAEWVSEQVAKA